jgi:hypothetical protein
MQSIYKPKPAAKTHGVQAAAVRAWAERQGYYVSDSGRIPVDLIREYVAQELGYSL